ncbi:restriction endonuclease [Clostridium tetani]|uniref:HIRAN domain-containing protein n=1 Tax=Clostridium tetani TaxID=1513 RepID=UPI002954DABA|nr:HIRAN domain-containing protein [Clostridium tetani]BDR72264.1 restriction endonuclease [Clostridium tetani]
MDFNETIYNRILKYVKENPDSVYLPQDFDEAGKKDAYFIFNAKCGTEKFEIENSNNLIKLISNYLNDEAQYNDLIEYIHEFPIIVYYFEFCRILEMQIKESLLSRKKVIEVGKKFVTESNDNEQIKLGITLLGLSADIQTKTILETIALHNEFTFYVVVSMKHWNYYNSFVFELAQKTEDYGKLHCVKNLEPINDEMKTWFIEESCNNTVFKSLSAIMCVDKVDMSWYLKTREITKIEFSNISRLIYYIFSVDENDIYELEDSLETVEFYLKYAEEYAEGFEDLCAIVYIKRWMRAYWEQFNVDIEKKNGWTSNIESKVGDICKNLLKDKKWVPVLKSAIYNAEEDVEIYTRIAESIGFDLTFNMLDSVLKKDKFNIEVFYFLYTKDDEGDIKNVIDYAKNTLPYQVIFSGSEEINEDDLTVENKPDICLLYILKYLNNCNYIEFELTTMALQARFQKCREEAIKYLRNNKEHWNEKIVCKIREAIEFEVNDKLLRKLKRLIGGETIDKKKERKYVDISKQRLKPHIKDIYLFSTYIAGVYYRDTSVVEDYIGVNDILFLKGEPENPYDKNAILVTNENGYVLGYLPKSVNKIPKNLLAGGKFLYAIIEEYSLESNTISIDVYLSCKDVIDSVEELMKISESKVNYYKQ